MLPSRRSARRSAAELLGAQASMRAFESVNSICRIDSTTVTVFPVPGLKYKKKNEREYLMWQEKVLRPKDDKRDAARRHKDNRANRP